MMIFGFYVQSPILCILTKSEKKEIFEMEFTYDNLKKKLEILYNNYLMYL